MKFDSNTIYKCRKCGYHQGVSWDGIMRKCKGCYSFSWVFPRNVMRMKGGSSRKKRR